MPESTPGSRRPTHGSDQGAGEVRPEVTGAGAGRDTGASPPSYLPASEAGAVPVAGTVPEPEVPPRPGAGPGRAAEPVAEKPLASPREMFQSDFRTLSLVSSVASLVAGAILIALPAEASVAMQLDGASEPWLRVLGAVGVLVGAAVALNARLAPRRDTIGVISAVYLGSAVFFLGAPFAFGVNVGWFGWLVLFGAALFTFITSLAWFFLHDWLTPVPDYVPKPDQAPNEDLAAGHLPVSAPPTGAKAKPPVGEARDSRAGSGSDQPRGARS